MSEVEFTSHIREAMKILFVGQLMLQPAALPAPAAASTTTLQEPGVDEADLIKSDGVHVFSLDPEGGTRNVLRRSRLESQVVPLDSLKLPFSNGVSATGAYLDGERAQLVALGERRTYSHLSPSIYIDGPWGDGSTEVALVSAADGSAMQVTRKLRINARLIGSRRIGSTLFLVMRSQPRPDGLLSWWQPDAAAVNAQLVASLQDSAQMLPALSVDDGDQQPLLPVSSCLHQPASRIKSASIVTIVAIDLASTTHRHVARCFVGQTRGFYMSERNVYLAPDGTSGVGSTDVHKFGLDGLSIPYRGSGNAAGNLGFDAGQMSFRMGEHEGVLRIITQSSWSDPTQSPARLTLLKESGGTLQTVGQLPNAARPQPLGKPGEQIYATRFLGTRGFVVTFKSIDPLYVLDLSNPSDPKIAGELEASGYSDYLFPLSENLLLGVGKDAVPVTEWADGRFAWYQGVQVTLIDVSDPAHPKETARTIVGRRGTGAAVLVDHHGVALLRKGNTVRVGLPVRLHETVRPDMTGSPSEWFDFTRTELRRFEVDLGAKTLHSRPALEGAGAFRLADRDRALLVDERVHWYQDGVWTSTGW